MSMAAMGTLQPLFWDAVKASAQQSEGVAQGLEEAKDAALAWEQQAQGALRQLDSLKDILEESAAWSGTLCSWQLLHAPLTHHATLLQGVRWSSVASHGSEQLHSGTQGNGVSCLHVNAWTAWCCFEARASLESVW